MDATSRPGENYSLLENMYNATLGQWRREMVHVANVVGGVEQINLYYGDADRRFFPIEPARQREAVAFLNENAFRTPEMFLASDITGRIGAAGAADSVLGVQRSVLGALINEDRIKRMSELVATGDETYAPAEMMADVTAGIWSELDSGTPSVDLYRRNLQRTHVQLLSERMDSDDMASDMPALARGELMRVMEAAELGLEQNPDPTTAGHLQDVMARVRLALDKVRVESAESGGGGRPRRGLEEF